MVLKPEKEKEAEAIFRKWGLDFAVVGYTTPSKRFVVKHGGDVMADLPIKELGDEAPLYDRPHVASPLLSVVHARDVKPPVAISAALETLIATPELCSKRWVWEQYDHVILGNTVQRPGGDAAVVRVQDGPKGLALTVDVTPPHLIQFGRYVQNRVVVDDQLVCLFLLLWSVERPRRKFPGVHLASRNHPVDFFD